MYLSYFFNKKLLSYTIVIKAWNTIINTEDVLKPKSIIGKMIYKNKE